LTYKKTSRTINRLRKAKQSKLNKKKNRHDENELPGPQS